MQFAKGVFAFLAFFVMPVCALAQANVTENQTTYVYVDANSGLDTNAGTQSSPLRTISKAATKATANNVKGVGTKVLINPGTYREFLGIYPTYKQTSAAITFEAVETGTAIIAASDILTGWSQAATNPAIYTHPWTYNFGACSIPSGWPSDFSSIVQRTEMIFVDGMPLTQVLSSALLQAGTFFVDETGNTINIWPSTTANMTTAVVEAAVRPLTMSISGRSNMVFRGLVFKHAASCMNQNGAMIGSSSNILVDSVQANWNNWGGLGVSGSNLVTVKNSVANHNGGVGFSAFHALNTLYQFDESDYNNWRGAASAFYDWGMGGTKFFANHSITVDQMHSYRNQAQGLWFDTDNKNISITNARLAENFLSNLQLEQDQGPISLSNSSLCSGGTGAVFINAAKVTATGNTFYNNGTSNRLQAQIYLAGRTGGRAGTDFETGAAYNAFTEGTTLQNNYFANGGPVQFVFSTYLSGDDWNRFTASLSSNNNAWSDPLATNRFQIPNGKLVDLRGWQGASSEDMASTWSSNAPPVTTCAVPATSFPDYNVTLDSRNYTMAAGVATIQLQVNSFNYGEVLLSVNGLPTGVTASYSKTAITSGTASLILTASAAAVNQTVPVTIIASDKDRAHSVTVKVHVIPGTGTPQLTVGPASLSFGSVTVNSASTQTVTLTSNGTAPVIVNSTSITGTGYTVVGSSLPLVLNPTQATTLHIQFTPTSAGIISGQLTVNSTSSSQPVAVVALSGSGVALTPQISISRPVVSFGSVTIGKPATQSVALTSTGTAALLISGITLSGSGFTVSGATFPTTLTPNQTITLLVQFNPIVAGVAAGQLTISSNSASTPVTVVSLAGTSIAPPNPLLAVSSTGINFGSVIVGNPATQSVVLTSTGNTAMTINSAAVSGAGFSFKGCSFPVTLTPGQSITLQVQFNPSNTGAATGQLLVSSNSSSGSASVVNLSGVGLPIPVPQLSVSVTKLSFGSVVLKAASPLPLILTSTGGLPVVINTTAITGSGLLVAGAALPLTLNPGQATTVWVLFAPVTAGAATGQLTISSNSSVGASVAVALDGVGIVSVP